jgi:lipid II:glycine glycyltransferase (peptidoglycan interpeptide bridge formation enzyme)
MIADALVLANPVYHFEEVIYNPDLYLKYMHDDLLNVIRKSKKPELQQSSALLKRIDTRDLYKLVGEASIHK